MTDMRMRPDSSSGYPGRTYRFYQGRKVYEFGYGLCYSPYSYKFLSITQAQLVPVRSSGPRAANKLNHTGNYLMTSGKDTESCVNMKISVVVEVKNTGSMAGSILYCSLRGHRSIKTTPMKQLVAFQTVTLSGGDTSNIRFIVNPCKHLSSANDFGVMVLEAVSYVLIVGEEEYSFNIKL
ncbi:hypothetical protein Droror1_Dr00002617 [Drosera rotundifolia]